MIGQSNANTILSYIKIENQDITVTENGVYRADPEYTGLGTVLVNVEAEAVNQDKTVTPSTSRQEVTADSGYTGLGTVTIEAVDGNIDPNITPDNIKKGVEILGVTGELEETNNGDLEVRLDGEFTAEDLVGWNYLKTTSIPGLELVENVFWYNKVPVQPGDLMYGSKYDEENGFTLPRSGIYVKIAPDINNVIGTCTKVSQRYNQTWFTCDWNQAYSYLSEEDLPYKYEVESYDGINKITVGAAKARDLLIESQLTDLNSGRNRDLLEE